ncbi:MAG: N-acetyl-gamma-glutamyl-phosphate reductase [Cyanobacteria bacterium P01_D01_bin.123]
MTESPIAVEPVTAGIVGASGYGGVQLVRLLLDHPYVRITHLAGHSSAGSKFSDLYPHLGIFLDLTIQPIDPDSIARDCQVVFLALPNGIACTLAPELLDRGCRVLDLSADYRFRDLDTYRNWYAPPDETWPTASHCVANHRAVYGLPELYREQIAKTDLVGCPGCYPTASLLAIAPLLQKGLIDPDSIIIDAKSGVSGAGRTLKTGSLFAEVDDSFYAYGVTNHRHTPEIEQICSDLAGRSVRVQFTPHLVPMVRGILATVYATLRDPGLVADDLLTLYRNSYSRRSPWVRILPPGTYPRTKWVSGTNTCAIGLALDSRTQRVIVMSAIDNLLKGQAGQAVQCLNLMQGWPEALGLPKLGWYP